MTKVHDFIATPPGATIREQLEDRGMSQKEFASRMNMSEKHISKLVNGEVQLTTDVAIRLETVLGVPAQFWIRLEAVYREKLLKHEAEANMESNIEIARQFPYSEMAQYGWVPATRKAAEKAERISDNIISEANSKASEKKKKADEDIAQERKKAVNEIKNEISSISVDIAQKVIEREINENDQKDLIDSFIDKIGDDNG